MCIRDRKKVAENASATQDEVRKATTKLQEAVNALQVKVTEKQNIGLKKPVTVSGTSNGVKESINDGNASTKWDSDLIKSGTGDEAQDIGDAWFAIDLGAVSYTHLIFPELIW